MTYWLCQIAGWGLYTALGVAMAVSAVGPQPAIFSGYALFFGYSIGLSHLLRLFIRRRRWLSLPMPLLLPRFVASAFVLSLALTLLVAIFRVLLGSRDFGTGWILSAGISLFAASLVWLTLYVAITSQRRSLELAVAARNAELRAIESQLNPHFLFNCLNTLRGMILEDPAKAQDMVTRLAALLRYNLKQESQVPVPLASEVEIVSDYLALEAMRFEDRLHVAITVDPAAARASIPPLLLQTLVENAVKHGIAQLPEGGDVTIRASLNGSMLEVSVENSGSLANTSTTGTGKGLILARERLRLMYGDRAHLDLSEPSHGRVTALVQLPRSV